MKLTEEIEHALNEYLNAEFAAWYRYLSVSSYFLRNSYEGFAAWCGRMAKREMAHSSDVADYISRRCGMVHLKTIEAAEDGWPGALSALKQVHLLEQKTSDLLNDALDLVIARRDHATRTFMEKCIAGQVHKELRLRSLIQKMELVGDSPQGLLLLDRDMRH